MLAYKILIALITIRRTKKDKKIYKKKVQKSAEKVQKGPKRSRKVTKGFIEVFSLSPSLA